MMDLICFSHLRWDFVYQRPQHLMSRAARTNRVFFIEEPIFTDKADSYKVSLNKDGVNVVTMLLRNGNQGAVDQRQIDILDSLFEAKAIEHYIFWYYTPMMMNISEHFEPLLTVYDCMDELAAFKNADPVMQQNEAALFNKAQVVFTGGQSLYNSKKKRHSNIHCYPSSIDFKHFAAARAVKEEPADQKNIPHPRLGFFGVVDERFDIELLREAAALKPDYQFVIIGPVVKIDPATLPQAGNIHYLGSKKYNELPAYVGGWDMALILFALNESTKFISPTKTPEYLAAGKPVLSTAITDVINPYEKEGLVQIVHNGRDLVRKAAGELSKKSRAAWLKKSDKFLANNSWDNTWLEMKAIIGRELKKQAATVQTKQYADYTTVMQDLPAA